MKVANRQKKTTKPRLTGKKFSGHKYFYKQGIKVGTPNAIVLWNPF